MKLLTKFTILFAIIFIFATQNNHTYSQTEFAPVGAQWHYKEVEHVFPGVYEYSNMQYVSKKDTLIQGKTCQIIKGNYSVNNNPYSEIIYKENGIVYYYLNEQFRKIYDFTVQIGDIIDFEFKSNKINSFNLDTSIIVPCIVESISTDTIDNISIKTFQTSIQKNEDSHIFEWPKNYIYSEKYGQRIIDFHFSFLPVITNLATVDEHYYYINCYSDSETNYVAAWWQEEDKPCDFSGTITSVNEFEKDNFIQVFPNPVNDQLNIQFSGNFNAEQSHIAIYDNIGKLIFEKEYSFEHTISIDIQNFTSGYYFLKIKNKNNIILTNKFIKL